MASNADEMEALLESMSGEIGIGCNPEGEALDEHPRYSQFKNYGKLAERQLDRRRDWMEKQRE